MSKMTMKECCDFQEGYVNPSQKNREYFEGPIKWLRASDLNDGIVYNTEKTLSNLGFESAGKSSFLFKPDTIAISKSGTIGKLGILKDFMCGNRAVINIDVNKSVADLNYVFYTLKYKKNEILGKAGGSIQKNLYVSALETITLNHSNLLTQKKIAKVLSDLDAKIEVNNKINQELEAMAKTLYDYWFVQFDFPDANGKPYKTSGSKMVFNAELKREIPERWEVKRLSDFADCNKWNRTKESSYDKINYLDTSSLTENVIESFQELDFERDKIPSRAQRIVSKNDILYSTVRPNQLHYGIIKRPIENLIASTGFAQIRSNDSKITNDFIYQILSQDYVSIRLQQIAVGSVSAYPSISHNDIMELRIALPLKGELINKATTIFQEYNDKVALNLEENQKLSELRDWLLPMLMNGQVTVGGVEQELAMVAEENAKYRSL